MRKKHTPAQIALALLIIVLTTLVLTAIIAFVFMLLWNWIAAGVFGLPTVGIFKAWGIMFLGGLIGKLLFGRK